MHAVPFHSFLHGIVKILISEAIDDGAHQGNHNSIEHRHHLVLAKGKTGTGSYGHEETRAIKEGHSSQVRCTGVEGLGSTFS